MDLQSIHAHGPYTSVLGRSATLEAQAVFYSAVRGRARHNSPSSLHGPFQAAGRIRALRQLAEATVDDPSRLLGPLQAHAYFAEGETEHAQQRHQDVDHDRRKKERAQEHKDGKCVIIPWVQLRHKRRTGADSTPTNSKTDR